MEHTETTVEAVMVEHREATVESVVVYTGNSGDIGGAVDKMVLNTILKIKIVEQNAITGILIVYLAFYIVDSYPTLSRLDPINTQYTIKLLKRSARKQEH